MLLALSVKTEERIISEESLKGKLMYIAEITCSDYNSSESCIAPYLALNECMRWHTYINSALYYTANFDTWSFWFIFRLEPEFRAIVSVFRPDNLRDTCLSRTLFAFWCWQGGTLRTDLHFQGRIPKGTRGARAPVRFLGLRI